MVNFQYISRKKISKIERIFWCVCILLTVVISIFLINQAIGKFLERKIGIKLSDERHGVVNVPFPAITICPEVLFNESFLESFLQKDQFLSRFNKLFWCLYLA